MNAPQAAVQTPEAKAAHDARWQRIMDCVALKQPDRMPTALFCTFWMAKYAGITNRELMYNYDNTAAIAEKVAGFSAPNSFFTFYFCLIKGFPYLLFVKILFLLL